MRLHKTREARQQQPLNQTLASADGEFDRLARACASEVFERSQCVTHNFIELPAGSGEFCGAMTSFEQLDSKVAFEFLELAAELTLPVRVFTRRRGDSASGHDLVKR